MGVTAAIGGAVIGGGASVLASNSQADASKKAAQANANAANEASETQLAMYNQTRKDLLPYMTGGSNAYSQLSSFLGPNGPLGTLLGLSKQGSAGMQSQLEKYPGYQFAVDQGQEALDRSAAARGLELSGGQLKDTISYGQNMADQLYGTYLNQLSGYGSALQNAAGIGENAAALTGSAGTSAATGSGNALLTGAANQGSALENAGTATASGYAGAANQIGSLLGNASLIGALNGNSGNVFGSSAGAANLGALALSDRRAKENVRRVGRTDSGLPVYTFNYRGTSLPVMGVMAQDVEKVAPHAVHTTRTGIKLVDYGKVSRLPAIDHLPLKRAA